MRDIHLAVLRPCFRDARLPKTFSLFTAMLDEFVGRELSHNPGDDFIPRALSVIIMVKRLLQQTTETTTTKKTTNTAPKTERFLQQLLVKKKKKQRLSQTGSL